MTAAIITIIKFGAVKISPMARLNPYVVQGLSAQTPS
jgi:hypothetical protein